MIGATANTIRADAGGTAVASGDEADSRAILLAYRAACWEYEPEHGDGGLDRVGSLRALLATVDGWIDQGKINLDEETDPSAMRDMLREVHHLCGELQGAVRAERASGVPAG